MTVELYSTSWTYPLHYGDTLSSHDWMPFYLDRFLRSKFLAHALAEDRRADGFTAVILWAESMKQDPAGTLPDDDVELARAAGFGADIEAWRRVREGALYGWKPVTIEDSEPGDTPRLGHDVIAQIAVDMHRRKLGRRQSREAANQSLLRHKVRAKLKSMGNSRLAEAEHVVTEIAAWLRTNDLYCTDDNVRKAAEIVAGVPKVVGRIGGNGD